jgi:hypothetical protein
MNLTEACSYLGRTIRGSVIDDVQVHRADPTDGRIYLMSGGERVIEVAGATHEHIDQLGKREARGGRPPHVRPMVTI